MRCNCAKQHNSPRLDTSAVVDSVSSLFSGYPSLIGGFNAFLPPGYSIVLETGGADGDYIVITTPVGTRKSKVERDVPVYNLEGTVEHMGRLTLENASLDVQG